ncbi:MAG: hypothetical protein QF492_09730, partial [Candidatus Krumholzibacteria bacterium]|nr:hypothetical protein [Candidatus Krumholzibacteria bacterium]
MSPSPIDNPAFRVLMKVLGLSPRDHEFRLEGSLESVQRILFVDSGQFADLLFFLPVIQEIRERWPSVAVQVMVEERWGDFLKREPGIEGIILYDPESLRFRSSAYRKLLREVKKRSFDAVVLMGTEDDSHRDLVAFASGVALRAGAYSEGRERILNCMVRWTGKDRYRSCFAQELSRLLGLRYEALDWRYHFRPDEVRAADQLIHFRKPSRDVLLIGVDPGAGLAEHQV